MKSLAVKRLSFVGLALTAVSVVTAAFMPSSKKSFAPCNGVLAPDTFVASGGAVTQTCTTPIDVRNCFITAESPATLTHNNADVTTLSGPAECEAS